MASQNPTPEVPPHDNEVNTTSTTGLLELNLTPTIPQDTTLAERNPSSEGTGEVETTAPQPHSTSHEPTFAPPHNESDAEEPTPEPTPIPEPALESASTPAPQPLLQVPQTPQTYINFLFLSNRRRLMNFEPDTTIGRVKELVWGAWGSPTNAGSSVEQSTTAQVNQDQSQIEERPPAPSYLRVLYLGRMLQDDETLRDLKLPTHLPTSTPHGQHAPVSTIMHLSIRPFPPPGEADIGKKAASRGFGRGTERNAAEAGEGVHRGGCCGCVIC